MCNGYPFTNEKNSPRAGLELGTARSVGQPTEQPGPLALISFQTDSPAEHSDHCNVSPLCKVTYVTV